MAPRAILRRYVKFDLERVESLLDSLGENSWRYPASNNRHFLDECRQWSSCVAQPGVEVIPLLHREVMNEERTVVQRTVALIGLGELEDVPDTVLTDLEALLSTPGETWSEAAMILVRQGEAWEQQLVELLKDNHFFIYRENQMKSQVMTNQVPEMINPFESPEEITEPFVRPQSERPKRVTSGSWLKSICKVLIGLLTPAPVCCALIGSDKST